MRRQKHIMTKMMPSLDIYYNVQRIFHSPA